MEPKVDFIGANKAGQGELAAAMLAQERMDPGLMRPYLGSNGLPYVTIYKGGDPAKDESYVAQRIQTNATLRRDEWKLLDKAVLAISETRLAGIQDLIANGLTFPIGNGMASTVLEHHTVSDAMSADMTMDGITRGQGDRPDYDIAYMPLPIVHVDYEINARVLASSRKLGNPLDTTSAERAARKVAEKLETMLFTDTSYAFGGGTIYSYLNEPNRNTVSFGAGNWDDSATGANIVTDVLAMKQASIDAKHYGPTWALYVPTAYETQLDEDYSTAKGTNTIRERILQIAGVNSIKVIDTLPVDTVLLVQMTTDVVRLVQGMAIQNVQWKEEGNLVTKYKVMTIQVPQVRADQDGNSGIVHLS